MFQLFSTNPASPELHRGNTHLLYTYLIISKALFYLLQDMKRHKRHLEFVWCRQSLKILLVPEVKDAWEMEHHDPTSAAELAMSGQGPRPGCVARCPG